MIFFTVLILSILPLFLFNVDYYKFVLTIYRSIMYTIICTYSLISIIYSVLGKPNIYYNNEAIICVALSVLFDFANNYFYLVTNLKSKSLTLHHVITLISCGLCVYFRSIIDRYVNIGLILSTEIMALTTCIFSLYKFIYNQNVSKIVYNRLYIITGIYRVIIWSYSITKILSFEQTFESYILTSIMAPMLLIDIYWLYQIILK